VDKNEAADIRIKNQALLEDKAFPRVVATLENRTVNPIQNVEVVAIVYDSNDNAVAASRTFVDILDKNASEDVVFTWPKALDFGNMACEKPADIMLVLDRSGSMDDDAVSPPEPLTTVKTAAESFVNAFKERDMAGVVSFATEASDPIDSILTSNFVQVGKVIADIFIRTDSPQNTNIASGILKAKEELLTERHRAEAKPVIVLLTDGIPSHPIDSDDPEFAKKSALLEAEDAKAKKIEVYVIGLGKKVDALFLRNLASGPEFYFEAVSGGEVERVYQNIATNICKKGPTKIQIIPLIK